MAEVKKLPKAIETRTEMTVQWVFLAAQLMAFEVRDDFVQYEEGREPGKPWLSDSVLWTVEEGKLEGAKGINTFCVLEAETDFKEVKTEVCVTPREAGDVGWKLASVVLFRSPSHFWHLALVEAPEDEDERHFFELVEMLEGRWLSQEGLPVVRSEDTGEGWNWNETYRLRLETKGDLVSGEVHDKEGELLWARAYRLERKAVRSGRPALRVSNMEAAFDDVACVAESPVTPWKELPPEIPAYEGVSHGPRLAKGTGFFRVMEREGRWWAVDPEGNAFFALGTDHCRFRGHWCEKLGYAPYGRNMMERFKSPEAWAESATSRLKDWGFNLLGAGGGEEARYQGLAHTEFLSFGSSFSEISDIVPKVHWTGLPNVFDPQWEAHCLKVAERKCGPCKENPWLFGYFLDNELEWYGKTHTEGGVFESAMAKSAGHSAKQALVRLLQERHGTVESFNEAWGTSLRTFEDLLHEKQLTASSKVHAPRNDREAFLAEVAERYFSVACRAVRSVDPNHLILGSRFAGRCQDAVWSVAGRHCDIVSFNSYPRIDLEEPLCLDPAKTYQSFHEKCGKRPMMMTEWSFPALDSGLPCMHGAGMRVDTQKQRATAFTAFQTTLMRLPFMVGSDFFMWVDEPALGISSTFPEDSNYGLVNEQDEPYRLLVSAAKSLYPQVYGLHQKELVIPNEGEQAEVQWAPSGTGDFAPTDAKTVFREEGKGFILNNGVLELIKKGGDGDVLDEICWREEELGRYNPLVWQEVKGMDRWVQTDRFDRYALRKEKDRWLLDVTCSFGNDVPEGTGDGIPFQVTHRLTVYPGTTWFEASVVCVKNTAEVPLILKGVFFYLPSALGGDSFDDRPWGGDVRVPNYYKRLPGCWTDPSGLFLGAGTLNEKVSIHFWLDENGGQHPDARIILSEPLSIPPGETWQGVPWESVFVYAGRGEPIWQKLKGCLEPLPPN